MIVTKFLVFISFYMLKFKKVKHRNFNKKKYFEANNHFLGLKSTNVNKNYYFKLIKFIFKAWL